MSGQYGTIRLTPEAFEACRKAIEAFVELDDIHFMAEHMRSGRRCPGSGMPADSLYMDEEGGLIHRCPANCLHSEIEWSD